MVVLVAGKKYTTWREMLSPPQEHVSTQEDALDHISYAFKTIVVEMTNYHTSIRRKVEILERYPELVVVAYDNVEGALCGTFFHHKVKSKDVGSADRLIALTRVEPPAIVVQLDWVCFFAQTQPLPTPTLHDFILCAVQHSNQKDEELRYDCLVENNSNLRRIPRISLLPPTVALIYSLQPLMGAKALMQEMLGELNRVKPRDNPIWMNGRNITVRDGNPLPEGACHDTAFALPYYPSILCLWHQWRLDSMGRAKEHEVPRRMSADVDEIMWGVLQHASYLG